MNTENLGPSYLSNLCFQFLATFLTWLWTFWLCPSLFSCLCLKNPFSDPKHTGIAFPKSQGSCVSLLVSKMITAWKFVIIQPFHFKVIQIPINLLLSEVQLVRQVITCRLPLSKLSLYFMVFRCSCWDGSFRENVTAGCQMHVTVTALLTQCLQKNSPLTSTLLSSMIKVVSWRFCNLSK